MSKRWFWAIHICLIAGFGIRFLLIGRLLFLVSVLPQFFLSLVSCNLMAFFLSAAWHYLAPYSYLFYQNIHAHWTNVSAAHTIHAESYGSVTVGRHYAHYRYLRQVRKICRNVDYIAAIQSKYEPNDYA